MAAAGQGNFQVGQTVLYIRYLQQPPVEEVTILEPEQGYAWRGELIDSDGNPGFILTTTVRSLRPYPVIPPGATNAEKDQILKNAMEAAELSGDNPGGVDPSYEPGALVITLRKRRQSNGQGNPWIAELMRLTEVDMNTYFKIRRTDGTEEYVSRYSLQPIPGVPANPYARAATGGARRRATRKARKSRRKSKRSRARARK